MDKARICVNQAKGAARRKTIKESQKLLVYEKKRSRNEAKKLYNLGGCTAPAAKKIRICTGAELKKMCPKQPPCKPPPAEDKFSLLARILWFALKAALAGGLVLITYQAGVWGDNDETQRLYEKLCAMLKHEEEEEEELDEEFKIVLGYCDQNKIFMNIPDDMPNKCPLPTDDSNMYYIHRKWNELIVEIGSVIVAGPVAFIYMVGSWLTPKDTDPDPEESKKKAQSILAQKNRVDKYNRKVHAYEERTIQERKERIAEFKKRYERRLRFMKKLEEEHGRYFTEEDEKEAEEEERLREEEERKKEEERCK